MHLWETNSTVIGAAGNKEDDILKLYIWEREHSFNLLLKQIETPGILLFSVVLQWEERPRILEVFGCPAASKAMNKGI